MINVMIVGCGRVGSELALLLEEAGHSVTVVDPDPRSFEKLGASFAGRTVQGVSFDRNVLERAGIRFADAFAATTPSDNANLVAAKVARDYFGVKQVVARIYNPHRRAVYERLGFQTAASSSWGAQRLYQLMLQPGLVDIEPVGSGEVKLLHLRVPAAWVGAPVHGILEGQIIVCALERDGRGIVPGPGERFQAGDKAVFSAPQALVAELVAQAGEPERA